MAHRGLRWLTRGLGGSQGASVAHTGLRWLTRGLGGSQGTSVAHKWLMHGYGLCTLCTLYTSGLCTLSGLEYCIDLEIYKPSTQQYLQHRHDWQELDRKVRRQLLVNYKESHRNYDIGEIAM